MEESVKKQIQEKSQELKDVSLESLSCAIKILNKNKHIPMNITVKSQTTGNKD